MLRILKQTENGAVANLEKGEQQPHLFTVKNYGKVMLQTLF